MTRGEQTYKSIETIISEIDRTFEITSVTSLGSNLYKLFTCNRLWATIGKTVTINAKNYVVTELGEDYITVRGTDAIASTVKSFQLYAPIFKAGTILEVANELTCEQLTSAKYPLIFMHEWTNERHNVSDLEPNSHEANITLYFLVEAKTVEWNNEKHKSLACLPMRNLVFRFVDALKISSLVNESNLETFDLTDCPKLGVYSVEKGSGRKIFTDDVSGCRMVINIPFYKQDCSC